MSGMEVRTGDCNFQFSLNELAVRFPKSCAATMQKIREVYEKYIRREVHQLW